MPLEQQRLKNADIIVMQYPAYWYAAPALVKKWQEGILTFGFAHDAIVRHAEEHGMKLVAAIREAAASR